MSISTETLYQIQKQPVPFCSIIDPIIDKHVSMKNDIQNIIKESNDLGRDRNAQESEEYIETISSVDYVNTESEDLEIEVRNMELWVNGWISILENNCLNSQHCQNKDNIKQMIETMKEKLFDFNRDTNTAFDKLEARIDEFNGDFESFNHSISLYNTRLMNSEYAFDQGNEEDLCSDAENTLNELDKSFSVLVEQLEVYREEATDIRLFMNDIAKPFIKENLLIVGDEDFVAYTRMYDEKNISKIPDFA